MNSAMEMAQVTEAMNVDWLAFARGAGLTDEADDYNEVLRSIFNHAWLLGCSNGFNTAVRQLVPRPGADSLE